MAHRGKGLRILIEKTVERSYWRVAPHDRFGHRADLTMLPSPFLSFPRSASLPLSYGFPVCQRWNARFILHVFSRVCALCKINLALQFWLNLMAVTLRVGIQIRML